MKLLLYLVIGVFQLCTASLEIEELNKLFAAAPKDSLSGENSKKKEHAIKVGFTVYSPSYDSLSVFCEEEQTLPSVLSANLKNSFAQNRIAYTYTDDYRSYLHKQKLLSGSLSDKKARAWNTEFSLKSTEEVKRIVKVCNTISDLQLSALIYANPSTNTKSFEKRWIQFYDTLNQNEEFAKDLRRCSLRKAAPNLKKQFEDWEETYDKYQGFLKDDEIVKLLTLIATVKKEIGRESSMGYHLMDYKLMNSFFKVDDASYSLLNLVVDFWKEKFEPGKDFRSLRKVITKIEGLESFKTVKSFNFIKPMVKMIEAEKKYVFANDNTVKEVSDLYTVTGKWVQLSNVTLGTYFIHQPYLIDSLLKLAANLNHILGRLTRKDTLPSHLFTFKELPRYIQLDKTLAIPDLQADNAFLELCSRSDYRTNLINPGSITPECFLKMVPRLLQYFPKTTESIKKFTDWVDVLSLRKEIVDVMPIKFLSAMFSLPFGELVCRLSITVLSAITIENMHPDYLKKNFDCISRISPEIAKDAQIHNIPLLTAENASGFEKCSSLRNFSDLSLDIYKNLSIQCKGEIPADLFASASLDTVSKIGFLSLTMYQLQNLPASAFDVDKSQLVGVLSSPYHCEIAKKNLKNMSETARGNFLEACEFDDFGEKAASDEETSGGVLSAQLSATTIIFLLLLHSCKRNFTA